ncbi:hypothetical protein RHGRI_036097 [Rhododendron griersonianum]|uniref:Uncharacterized protein n=1 Tax=Rhododendron griersonianum TaxID=479676 RepID=A0AAV6HSE9_9ERIC|nr:hypothetical protein RHGRI_036097 [Rhododendron griersonianum]
MHRCSLESPFLVNAEVDYMGGFVDCGVGIGTKTSPRRAAIEKVQAELRQENDVIEERRRELEFLEKGGNPLDFRLRNAASVRVESTSLNDQPLEQFVTSEAEGSFALTTSPHGDSLESSGRPGAPTVCGPICTDNLLLFDLESDFLKVGVDVVLDNVQALGFEPPCDFNTSKSMQETASGLLMDYEETVEVESPVPELH